MEAVSFPVNNQILPISGDETENFTAYSSAVHKVIVMVNAGILGLLQLTNQQSLITTSSNAINSASVLETHKPSFLCFCLLVLFYAVLRVGEAIDARRRPGFIGRLVGLTSHLFGSLAAIVLVSIVYVTFSLALLLLWFLCLSTVVYNTFKELMIDSGSPVNISGAGSHQLPPV